jgi:uncharacterized YccA/Bax inhibitor family protein
MSLFKSGNPALSEKRFRDTVLDDVITNENAMTAKGTLNKFGFLMLLTLGSSYYSWKEAAEGGNAMPLVLVGVIGGLVLAIIMAFKQQWSPYLAPAYALLEGLFVGAISAFFEYQVQSRQGGYQGGYSGIAGSWTNILCCCSDVPFIQVQDIAGLACFQKGNYYCNCRHCLVLPRVLGD